VRVSLSSARQRVGRTCRSGDAKAASERNSRPDLLAEPSCIRDVLALPCPCHVENCSPQAKFPRLGRVAQVVSVDVLLIIEEDTPVSPPFPDGRSLARRRKGILTLSQLDTSSRFGLDGWNATDEIESTNAGSCTSARPRRAGSRGQSVSYKVLVLVQVRGTARPVVSAISRLSAVDQHAASIFRPFCSRRPPFPKRRFRDLYSGYENRLARSTRERTHSCTVLGRSALESDAIYYTRPHVLQFLMSLAGGPPDVLQVQSPLIEAGPWSRLGNEW
jgi:hypothetical protein